MIKWLRSFLSRSEERHHFRDQELKQMHNRYQAITAGIDFSGLIAAVQSDEDLKRRGVESGLRFVMTSGDFYEFYRGGAVTLDSEGFHAYATPSCLDGTTTGEQFPMSIEGLRQVFPENFTPEMLRLGILNYIVSLDNACSKPSDASSPRTSAA